MKLIEKLFLTSILFLILPILVWSQSHPLLQDFSGFQQGESVFLRWTFRSGSLCEGTRIERSQDGMIFTEIGEIPGICGSPEVAFTYTFTDSTPLSNASNIYRLELGNTGFTTNLQVEYIAVGDEGYSLLSTGNEVELLIANPPARNGVAQVFDISGNLVSEFSFNNRRFLLTENIFRSGVYIFRLQYENGAVVSGKFIRL
jgi:hypothetical protein